MKKQLVFLSLLASLFMTGCLFVGKMTNHFPPGRNEMGVGARNVNDIFLYSDTGETKEPEASSLTVETGIVKPVQPGVENPSEVTPQ